MSCSCNASFKDYISQFPDTVVVYAKLEPETDYFWEIKDQFQNTYVLPFTTDADGYGTIVADDLPAGLLNASMACLTIQVKETELGCDYVKMPIVTEYEKLIVQVKTSNITKNNIGCVVAPINVVPGTAYWLAKDDDTAPTEEELMDGTAVAFTTGQTITYDLTGLTSDKWIFLAEPVTEPEKTRKYAAITDNELLGPDGQFNTRQIVGDLAYYPSNFPTSNTQFPIQLRVS